MTTVRNTLDGNPVAGIELHLKNLWEVAVISDGGKLMVGQGYADPPTNPLPAPAGCC